jgi:signal transduction histidine kinase
MKNLGKYFSTPIVMVTVILLGFCGIIGLFLYSDIQTERLSKKKVEAQTLVFAWDTLENKTKDLLTTDDLEEAIKLWMEAITRFEKGLNSFMESNIIKELSREDEKFKDKIKETEKLWYVIKPRIKYVQPGLNQYLEQEAKTFKRSLLHELLYQVEKGEQTTDYQTLFDLTYDIEYMVSSLSEYFVSVLTDTVEMISYTIDQKTRTIRILAFLAALLIITASILFITFSQKALSNSEKQLRFLSAKLIQSGEDIRKRIASELHDEVGQALTAIKYSVENTQNYIKSGKTEESAQSLEHLIGIIQNALGELRKIGRELRPAILDQLGIIATISWFCREYQKVYTTIHLEQHIDIEETDVPDHLKTVIYRILQEALTNVAKHSNADHVTVCLEKKARSLELLINDNGTGFNVPEVRSHTNDSSGFGLISMEERVEFSGGRFEIDSMTGRGTKIRASWVI